VEEDDAQVGHGRLRDEAAVHVGVAARLVDEQPAHVVQVLAGPAPPLQRGAALQRRDPVHHDAERLPRGVVVDRRDRRHASNRGTAAKSADAVRLGAVQ